MAKISCGEATIRLLEKYGVDTVFGIPGVHTLEFYRALGEGSAIRHVQARNELGAGFMADGYARSSGKPGVCLTISGPGVTNAATALGQAWADSLPLLLISAEAPSHTLGKGRGALHEVTDLNAVTRPLTAFSVCASHAEEVPELLSRAFESFSSGRPRPVHIAIPTDILETLVEDDWTPGKPSGNRPDDTAKAGEIAKRVRAATMPVLLVGGGAAGADVTALAERSGAIVLSSNAGKGIVPENHPLSLGGALCRPEGRNLLASADLVIAIGTEMSETDSYVENLNLSGGLVRIDIDPSQITNNYPAEISMVCDASAAVDAILGEMGGGNADHRKQVAQVENIRKEIRHSLSGSEPKHAILLERLRDMLPDEALIMSDATQITYSASFLLPVNLPRRFHYAAGYCALGFAFPNAIGAKFANPELPVVAIAGDGGTMFTVQELVTAAEQKLPIPLILWHNDGYKQIRDDMRSTNVPRVAVDGIAPDYPALARAMHCHAVQPDSPEAFAGEIRNAFKADRPTLIVVREDSPWLNPA
jgi:thiamine pyrophosphate-dependent acetolactate synthase large subunit-like protein